MRGVISAHNVDLEGIVETICVHCDEMRRRCLLLWDVAECRAWALGGQEGDWLLVIAPTPNTARHCALHTALLVTSRTPVMERRCCTGEGGWSRMSETFEGGKGQERNNGGN